MQFNTQALDDLAARIGAVLQNSPARDLERNVKALLQSGLSRLDLVPRSEFDVQAQVLIRTREKVEALEARLTAMETRLGGSSSGAAAQELPPSEAPSA
jgi:BMFP domain-containing protein YqiC